MRLKKEAVEKLAKQILARLKEKPLLKFRVSETKVLGKIHDVIMDDLVAESRLEDEARKLMDKYRPQIASGALDERKAFLMIKKQLAKEKKMVL